MSNDPITKVLMENLTAITPGVEKTLVTAAELWQLGAVKAAREEDPHRIPAFVKRFADQPVRHLAMRYQPDGSIRVSLWLVGIESGQEVGMEVCAQDLPGVPLAGA